MRESYRKGVASHPVPESRVVTRKAEYEALTGVHASRVLSCEIYTSRVPTQSNYAEGHTGGGENASLRRTLRSLKPQACMETPRARTVRLAQTF